MKEKFPLVSVVMLLSEQDRYATESRSSVKEQTYPNIELISIDISKIGRKAGLAEGCKRAAGDYIAFLEVGDIWRRHKLAEQMAALQKDEETGCVFSWCDIMDENGKVDNALYSDFYFLYAQNNRPNQEWIEKLFMQIDCFCLSSALLRKEAVEKAGGFETNMQELYVQELWLRLLNAYTIYIIEKSLTKRRKYKEKAEDTAAMLTYQITCMRERVIMQQEVLARSNHALRQQEQYVVQLIEAVGEEQTFKKNMKQFTYRHLAELYEYAKGDRENLSDYINIANYIFTINESILRTKKKVEIALFVDYAATYSYGLLYEALANRPDVKVYIVMTPDYVGTVETLCRDYKNTYECFKEKGYLVFRALNTDTMELYTWEELKIAPDIIFRPSPWHLLGRGDYYLLNCPLNVLNVYIPYGIMLAENEQGNFVYKQYNQLTHELSWKIFEDTGYAIEMAKKYSDIGDFNTRWLGYPKMDLIGNVYKETEPKAVKKIIYAPHHSIKGDLVAFSTFAENYRMMLELAKKYTNISWVIRPHQRLGDQSVEAGVFADIEEYRQYLAEWEALPNASVSEGGTYEKLFAESDGMILDCVSFLAEYMYAHKPLLFLRRAEQCFNDLGEKLVKIHYTAEGNDKRAIENFIDKVLIDGEDAGREEREAFFEKYLAYDESEKSAAENIAEYICGKIGK